MTKDEAYQKAASLCAKSEKCPADIVKKLTAWEIDDDAIEEIIDQLTREKFLDEERYALAFVADKFRFEHWGRIKINYALRTKGIRSSAIRQALDERIDPDEYVETCTRLLRDRMRSMPQPLSPNDRARLYRFGTQRGFESGIISRALSLINQGDEDDD